MTNVRYYGQEAEIACQNEPGFKVKMDELREIFRNSKCEEGDMIAMTSDGDYGYPKAEFTANYYTCAPFAHQKNVISSVDYHDIIANGYDGLCPEGYNVKDLTQLKSGHTVVTCMGVIEDATSGNDMMYGTCTPSEL